MRKSVIVFCLFNLLLLSSLIDAQWKAWDANIFADPGSQTIIYEIIRASDGNYVSVGFTGGGATTGGGFILKSDTGGNEIWSTPLTSTGEFLYDVRETPEGDFIVIGDVMIKTDSLGVLQWSRPIEGDAIELLPGGGYAIGLTFDSTSNLDQMRLVITDTAGTVSLDTTYGTSDDDDCYDIEVCANGDIVLAGNTDFDGSNAYMIRVDSTGDSIWANYYDGIFFEAIYEIEELPDGSLIANGTTSSGGGGDSFEFYFLKTEADGDSLWVQFPFPETNAKGQSIILTSDSAVLLSGYNINDVYFGKYTYDGDSLWTSVITNDNQVVVPTLAESSIGWYVVGGTEFDVIQGSFMMKILPSPLIVVAYSPVNIIVTSPDGQQYGRDADGVTIDEVNPSDSAEYFEPPSGTDSLVINRPLQGTYTVEFVTETGTPVGETYSAIIKTDGTQAVILIIDGIVPSTGQTDSFEFILEEDIIYVAGDANGDASLNVGDAVFLINYVFKGGPAPDPMLSADANCDGGVTIGDAVYIINHVFKGGPPPCDFDPGK